MSILQASKIHKAVHFGKNLQAFLLVVDTRLPMFENTTDYVTRRSRHNSRQLLRRRSRGRVAGMNCAEDEHCKNNQ